MRYFLKLIKEGTKEELNVLLESSEVISVDFNPLLQKINFNLTKTGINPGQYSNPVFRVDAQGRIVEIVEGTDLQAQIDDIKFELKSNSPAKYKEFIYNVDDELIKINIWTDNTMTTKLYQVDFTYTGDDLTQKQVKRISDNLIYTTVYNYSSDKLVSTETT